MPEIRYKITYGLECELRPEGYRPGWSGKDVIEGIRRTFEKDMFGDATDVVRGSIDMARNALECKAEAHIYVIAHSEAEALVKAREQFVNLDFGDLVLNRCSSEKIEAFEPYIQKRGIS